MSHRAVLVPLTTGLRSLPMLAVWASLFGCSSGTRQMPTPVGTDQLVVTPSVTASRDSVRFSVRFQNPTSESVVVRLHPNCPFWVSLSLVSDPAQRSALEIPSGCTRESDMPVVIEANGSVERERRIAVSAVVTAAGRGPFTAAFAIHADPPFARLPLSLP